LHSRTAAHDACFVTQSMWRWTFAALTAVSCSSAEHAAMHSFSSNGSLLPVSSMHSTSRLQTSLQAVLRGSVQAANSATRSKGRMGRQYTRRAGDRARTGGGTGARWSSGSRPLQPLLGAGVLPGMRIALTAVLVSLSLTAPAAADPRPPVDVGKMATDDCARARRAKKDCVLTIEGSEIDGSTPRNTGTTVTVVGTTQHPSLIRIRREFIQEILKTAEDL